MVFIVAYNDEYDVLYYSIADADADIAAAASFTAARPTYCMQPQFISHIS